MRIVFGMSVGVLVVAAALVGCNSQPKQPTSRDLMDDPIMRTELRERAIEMLTDLTQSEDAQVRANAVEALKIVPARLQPVAAMALLDENLGVRAVGAMAVGDVELRDLMPAVEPLLDDPSPMVQVTAVYAMRRFGAQTDPTPIARMLLTDPSPRSRAQAAMILGRLGNTTALPMLREAASASMPMAPQGEINIMQLQIAEAMVNLGDERQVQSIRAALYPSSPLEYELAAFAIQILGEVNDAGSMEQLIHLATFTTSGGQQMPPEIRLEVAVALGKMGRRDGAFLAEQYYQDPNAAVRAQSASAFGYSDGPTNLERLNTLMSDSSPRVRIAAANGTIRYIDRNVGRALN